MEDTAKYLIHADVTADGVVERSDVVGAVFGQTEGLLGTEMDLRTLQEASKVGRIDVDVDSERGRSFGELTIASSLDRVETAVLGAALETITRIGPCHAEVRISGIEDVRAAKRREVVDRAKELMTASFDDSVLSTQEILEEVRRSVRVEDVTEYEGLPAGPHVGESDAIIVVEGRADVIQLLQYGIKNAVAVEGTNVPEAVGDLTEDRTVTAFFDGDRGGDLILKELAQVGDVDYVALAPPGRSVEDLSRREVTESLREKMSYEVVTESEQGIAATDGSVRPAPADDSAEQSAGPDDAPAVPAGADGTSPKAGEDGSERAASSDDAATGNANPADGDALDTGSPQAGETQASGTRAASGSATGVTERIESAPDAAQVNAPDASQVETADAGQVETTEVLEQQAESDGETTETDAKPSTLADHVRDVAETETVRLLDDSFGVLAESPSEEAFETVERTDEEPWAVVLDGSLSQRVLDVAAQRGVAQVVARETGDFVKRPTSVRIRTTSQLLDAGA